VGRRNISPTGQSLLEAFGLLLCALVYRPGRSSVSCRLWSGDGDPVGVARIRDIYPQLARLKTAYHERSVISLWTIGFDDPGRTAFFRAERV